MSDFPVAESPPHPEPDRMRSMPLHVEEATVSKRVRRTLVRAARTTTVREESAEADLETVQVVLERVPVGRVVDEVPPIRTADGVTIMPVVEEELVLVRRLVLKEEVHLRTVRSMSRHAGTVSLRKQGVSITRTPLED